MMNEIDTANTAIEMRKLTRDEHNQLSFINSSWTDDKPNRIWKHMAPLFSFGERDILFIHLVGIGFTPVEVVPYITMLRNADNLLERRIYYETEFKEFLHEGRFASTDEFIAYYQENIMPFVIAGTARMLEGFKKELEELQNA